MRCRSGSGSSSLVRIVGERRRNSRTARLIVIDRSVLASRLRGVGQLRGVRLPLRSQGQIMPFTGPEPRPQHDWCPRPSARRRHEENENFGGAVIVCQLDHSVRARPRPSERSRPVHRTRNARRRGVARSSTHRDGTAMGHACHIALPSRDHCCSRMDAIQSQEHTGRALSQCGLRKWDLDLDEPKGRNNAAFANEETAFRAPRVVTFNLRRN
jgi:hypothetical protein